MKTYHFESCFNVIGKLLVKDILADLDEHMLDFFIEYENEDPLAVYKNISYLESLNPLKKVWVMTYDTDLGQFGKVK